MSLRTLHGESSNGNGLEKPQKAEKAAPPEFEAAALITRRFLSGLFSR
jgi:hypothetical protein